MVRMAIATLIFTTMLVIYASAFTLTTNGYKRQSDPAPASSPSPKITCDPSPAPATPIYGVTIESVENLQGIVDSLREVGKVHRPTTRIVFQQKQSPSDYVEPIRRIKEVENVSDIMGLIGDSSSMYKYGSVSDYQKRVTKYLTGLPRNVDIWEIGNEVNGEWVGWKKDKWEHKTADQRTMKRELVSQQITEGFKLAKAQGKTTALTLYYNGDATTPCWSTDIPDGREYEMFTWVANYLKDPELRACVDYVFISFYEDDCKILTHDARTDAARFIDVFNRLSVLFPKANVGFDEFGPQCYYEACNYDTVRKKDRPGRNRTCPQCIADQKEFLPRYFADYDSLIKAKVPRYVGGYFYWYFWQDMVPGSKPALRFLTDAISPRRR